MRIAPLNAVDRVDFILEEARRRRVLHVGCCDAPFTAQELARGTLLHQRLVEASTEVAGLDSDAHSVNLMTEAGVHNLWTSAADLRKALDARGEDRPFDLIVLGEVLEHVLSVDDLVSECQSVASPDATWVVTVPNAVPLKRFWRLAFGVEEVHPDHVCYFSPATLSTLMRKLGFDNMTLYSYWRDVGAVSQGFNKVVRRVRFLQPFCDGLCGTFRLRSADADE